MHTLAVTEQGTAVHVEGEQLLVKRQGKAFKRVRVADLDQVLLFGRVELSSGAVAVLARRGIDVVFLTLRGMYRARLIAHGSNNVLLRLAQMRRSLDPEFAACVARSIVRGKIWNQRQVLLRAQRHLKDPDVAQSLGRLRLLVEQADKQTDLDQLRGVEGQAAALYFRHFGRLIRSDQFCFTHRNRRPPRDPINAGLSFGYALLANMVESEVNRCGLDPMIGFFHQPAFGRPSLVLDLMEEFRPIVDRMVLSLVNRRQLGIMDFQQKPTRSLEATLADTTVPPTSMPSDSMPSDSTISAIDEDVESPPFDVDDEDDEENRSPPAVYLSDTGRRIFLTAFFRRMRERTEYGRRRGKFELRQILREQVYHLARVIDQKDPTYVAFVPK